MSDETMDTTECDDTVENENIEKESADDGDELGGDQPPFTQRDPPHDEEEEEEEQEEYQQEQDQQQQQQEQEEEIQQPQVSSNDDDDYDDFVKPPRKSDATPKVFNFKTKINSLSIRKRKQFHVTTSGTIDSSLTVDPKIPAVPDNNVLKAVGLKQSSSTSATAIGKQVEVLNEVVSTPEIMILYRNMFSKIEKVVENSIRTVANSRLQNLHVVHGLQVQAKNLEISIAKKKYDIVQTELRLLRENQVGTVGIVSSSGTTSSSMTSSGASVVEEIPKKRKRDELIQTQRTQNQTMEQGIFT